MSYSRRSVCAISACLLVAACSTTPTAPTATIGQGPVISQGPLVGLIPQEPPPLPPRLSASPPPVLGASNFVAFGDSITYGSLSPFDASFVYDDPAHSYPVRLEIALDTYHAPRNYTVVNSGIPGEWAADGARRISGVITTNRPQGLLLLEGVNDLAGAASVSTVVGSLRRIVDMARTNNVTVLVATMPQTYEAYDPIKDKYRDNAKDLIVPFNDAVRSAFSTQQNVYIVDLYRAFGTNRSLIGGDGLHPTESGYQLIASTFLSSIETVFAVRGSFQ